MYFSDEEVIASDGHLTDFFQPCAYLQRSAHDLKGTLREYHDALSISKKNVNTRWVPL